MNKQVTALTKVIGKKEEQLQALRHHQTHMTTTIEQLQGEVEKNSAAAAADRAAKTYAADLQTKVRFCSILGLPSSYFAISICIDLLIIRMYVRLACATLC